MGALEVVDIKEVLRRWRRSSGCSRVGVVHSGVTSEVRGRVSVFTRVRGRATVARGGDLSGALTFVRRHVHSGAVL